VERSSQPGMWVVIARDVLGPSYEDTGLASGTTYQYAIMATSGAGYSVASAAASVQTGAAPAPTGAAPVSTPPAPVSTPPAPVSTPPVADALASQPLVINVTRRQAFRGVVAAFADANVQASAGSFVAMIHWGDGSESRGTVTGSDGRFQVVGQHRYAAAGRYAVKVAVTMSAPSRATTSIVSTATVGRPLRVVKETAKLHQALSRTIHRP
jgi:hypothetical protein